MTTPSIAKLGHVGLHVHDLEKEKAFYRDIVGLTVTDEDPGMGMVFMSARPEEEHHELLLCGDATSTPTRRSFSSCRFAATVSTTSSATTSVSRNMASRLTGW